MRLGVLPLLLLPGVASSLFTGLSFATIAYGGWKVSAAMKGAEEAKRRVRAARAAEIDRWRARFVAEAELDAQVRAAVARQLPLAAVAISLAGMALAFTPSVRR